MNGFIYIIRNTVNQKVYIGQTRTSVEQRWKEHLRHAKNGDQLINRAMRKYGTDKFYVETLEICSIDVLDEREIYYIGLFDSTDKAKGYNVSLGGNTPKFKEKALNISVLIDLYTNKRLSLSTIASKFNTTIWIVRRELKRQEIKIRDRHDSATRFSHIPKEELLKALELKGSLRSSAEYLGISYNTFRKACISNNIEYNLSKSAQHPNG